MPPTLQDDDGIAKRYKDGKLDDMLVLFNKKPQWNSGATVAVALSLLNHAPHPVSSGTALASCSLSLSPPPLS